MSTRNS